MSELILVTLPIGNIEDITLRAKSLLEKTNIIYAEDTRVFKSLCQEIGVDLSLKQIDSFHDHSASSKIDKILSALAQQDVCIVSDAGSPIISDPAFPLIQAVVENGYSLNSAPGVSSVIVALELSAIAPIPFHFHAFIPRDKGKISSFVEKIKQQQGTHIFFEGVSRVKNTLDLMSEQLPEAQFAVCRELTKKFQSVYRFKGQEWKSFAQEIVYKGEFVIVVYIDAKAVESSPSELQSMVSEMLEQGVHPKKLSKLFAEITGDKVKDIYSRLSKK